jgi:hypothetical protein
MKQIVNSYMINRYIANRMKPGIPSDSVFYKKLLKLTILFEQWPYQMPWMLFLGVDNLQQELEIENRTRVMVNELVVRQLKLVKASRLSSFLQRYSVRPEIVF